MIRPATPQRTAERVRTLPAPTMAPVMVCVVETGMPSPLATKSAMAPLVSAHTPPTGASLVMRIPMVRTDHGFALGVNLRAPYLTT